jgi:hypothetical protein
LADTFLVPADTGWCGFEDGTPVHVVSQMLGHSKPSITLDVYAHAVSRGGEMAGERLTALLAEHVRD